MNRYLLIAGSGLLLGMGLCVSTAVAEKSSELTIYVPAQDTPTLTEHVNSLTVGTPYQATVLPDGTLLVSRRMGIGTTVPAGHLHVIGSPTDINLILQAASGQTTTNLLELRDAANTTLLRINPAGGLFVKTNDRNILPLEIQGVLNQSADLLQVNDVNAKRLLAVTSTGAVGIGTSTPAGRLHVQGPDDAAGIATFMAGADTGAPGVPTMSMGIGTTTPTQRLHVAGVGGANRTLAKFGDSPGAVFLLHSDPAIAANAFDDGTWRYDGNGFASVINFQNGMHRFFTAPNNTLGIGTTATFTERMRITNTGDVGIGTTAPAGRLHVQGVDDAASIVTFMPGVDTPIGGFPSLNVGIGTTAPKGSPGVQLEVKGSVKFAVGTPHANDVLTSDASGNASWATAPSGGGPTFFSTPVPLLNRVVPDFSASGCYGESGSSSGWKTFDASSVIPAGATAVILQARIDFHCGGGGTIDINYFIKIRKNASSPEYLSSRWKYNSSDPSSFVNYGVFPITSARTFDYFVDDTGSDKRSCSCAHIIGYY